jgi:hypothetical protein
MRSPSAAPTGIWRTPPQPMRPQWGVVGGQEIVRSRGATTHEVAEGESKQGDAADGGRGGDGDDGNGGGDLSIPRSKGHGRRQWEVEVEFGRQGRCCWRLLMNGGRSWEKIGRRPPRMLAVFFQPKEKG